MGSLGDRIRRLEAARGAERETDAASERRRRAFDKLFHLIESDRREQRGEPPLETPAGLVDTKDDVLHTLHHVIPRYKQSPGYQHGSGAEFVREWENSELEKLAELEKGTA